MAFVTEAALIALREGLEALLITGILLGLVTRLGRPDARKHVWIGFWSAVAVSVVGGWAVQRYLLTAFEEQGGGALFELIAALLAVATLTYMVFWMWSHTTQVIQEAKDRVAVALTTGSLVTIVFIAFISVLREGLETVLFYSALAGQASGFELAWSGAVGFAVSAGLVYAILRGSRKIGLKRFFTATGIFLIIVAAMLLTHVAGAMTELGWIDPQPAIWDTSALIADGSIAGRLLHATLGYTATPTLLQATLYFGYLFIAGGAYAWVNGAFHRRSTQGRELLPRRLAAFALALLLIGTGVGAAGANPTSTLVGAHSHGPDEGHADGAAALPEDLRVGVMLRAHGEPVTYNATTYQSFAHFTRNLLVQFGMEELLAIDQGTVLVDRERPYAQEPRLQPDLMDAWLDPYELPAVHVGNPVPGGQDVPAFEGMYLAAGGPGLGEPDILEAAGLGIWKDYIQMENQSPMHRAKAAILDQVTEELVDRFGDQVVVERAYHIKPMLQPYHEDLGNSVQRLVEAEVDVIVDAYTSHLHSDIMNECMKKQAFLAALDEHGYDGPVVHAGPSGLTESFAQGMADAIADRIQAVPTDQQLWVSLTHHGADPDLQSYCRDRPDPYVAQTQAMFENVEAALANRSLPAGTAVHMVYGNGAGDPQDGIYAPMEAVENASAQGFTHVLDLPYELPGDGFDNLVLHRLNYELDPRQAPHYGPGYETQLVRHGLAVTITSSQFATETRAHAQVDVILDALSDHLGTDLHPGGHHP